MELTELRKQINEVDAELLPLFLRRMKLAEEVAEVKKKQGLPVYNAAREREILSRVSENAGDMGEYARLFYNHLFELSRSRQIQLMECTDHGLIPPESAEPFPQSAAVACLEAEGENSGIAAGKAFRSFDLIQMKTIDAVFQAVESGMCRFGMLPMENSALGSVKKVYDQLRSQRCSIVRSVRVDTESSFIRFIVIEKSPKVYAGSDRISLMFSLPDAPGSLNRIVSMFSCRDINIVKLELRCTDETHFEYYMDIDASAGNPAVRQLINHFSLELPAFAFLGAYQEV